MIEAQNLTKQFDQFVAVDGINLTIPAGQVLALLGPNGAGKTTTVRMLTSVLKPTRGRASVAGFDTVQHARHVRGLVGVLTEAHGLYDRMQAAEYLEFYGELYSMPAARRKARINDLLNQFDLGDAGKRRIGEFSKGMRQKLALARALLHEPAALLLDEPTSAMDPASARLVRNAIADLRSAERAIILCTHNLQEAEELADQIAIIRRGRIIAAGTAEQLKQRILGPAEFQASLTQPIPDGDLNLPPGIRLTSRGPDWLRFHSDQPRRNNPQLLQMLLAKGLDVHSLAEMPRTLEQVYLKAVEAADSSAASHEFLVSEDLGSEDHANVQ